MGIIGVTIWVIGVVKLLTKSPDPPSRGRACVLRSPIDQGLRAQHMRAVYLKVQCK